MRTNPTKGRKRAAEPEKAAAGEPGAAEPKRRVRSTTRRIQPPSVGRPSLLTPEVRDRIVGPIRAGNYLETAVKYSGLVSVTTVYNWLARARREIARLEALRAEGTDGDVKDPDPKRAADEGRFVEFLEAVEQAEAEAEAYHVTNVRTLAQKSEDDAVRLRASLAFLGRKHPKRWSEAERSEVTIAATVETRITVEEQRSRTAAILDVAVATGAFEAAKLALDAGEKAEDAT